MVLKARSGYRGAMHRDRINNAVLVVAFGLFGVACRFVLQATETRLQIVAVCVLAIAVDRLAKPMMRLRPSRTWCAAAAAAGTAGMLIVRWNLEGLCPHNPLPHCLPWG
ncbi:hypothetical protein KZ810_02700 [Sphingomonas sp. RHCKR47]|uniref:hypothetical protein n=1 Tax=Sphingomonas citricola TaxID=2862498 RepID=UPI001CA56AA9|nr:hypothetical protein [Sphingomonas citricola]MBW6522397.1 hypothetical protein [Sphingomonas citricola]